MATDNCQIWKGSERSSTFQQAKVKHHLDLVLVVSLNTHPLSLTVVTLSKVGPFATSVDCLYSHTSILYSMTYD